MQQQQPIEVKYTIFATRKRQGGSYSQLTNNDLKKIRSKLVEITKDDLTKDNSPLYIITEVQKDSNKKDNSTLPYTTDENIFNFLIRF